MTTAAPLATLFDSAFMAQLEKLSIVAKRAKATGDRGGRRSERRGASVEFADHRSYNPGDDFRRIDWNLYGRLGKLFLKLFVEEVDLTLHLVLDASASMAFGTPPKLDMARRLAAALAYVALGDMDRVSLGVATPSGMSGIGPLRGKAQVFKVFGFLDRVVAEGSLDLGAMLTALPPPRGGVTVILSDFLHTTPVDRAVTTLLASRQRVVLLQVLAPEEIQPDFQGDFTLVDSETGQVVDVTSGPRALEAYRAGLARLQESLAAHGKRGPCTHLVVPSDADFVDQMLQALPAALVVR